MSKRILLNRRMALETMLTAPDGAGGVIETPQVLGYLWVHVAERSGRLSALEGVTLSAVPVQITVRSASRGSPRRPRAGQTLVEGARRFRIISVIEDDDAGRFLTCVAREEEVSQ